MVLGFKLTVIYNSSWQLTMGGVRWSTLCCLVFCFESTLLQLSQGDITGRPVDPVQDRGVLWTYSVNNSYQCGNLCWYRGSCQHYAFYNKNDKGKGGHNCVLYTDSGGGDGELSDGWVAGLASDKDLVGVQ